MGYLSYICRCLFLFLSVVLFNSAYAATDAPNFKKIFGDKKGCFIMYPLNSNTPVVVYNEKQCERRFSPGSTFKIVTSLMGYDKNILIDEHHPVINYQPSFNGAFPAWRQAQDPTSWIKYSVVWYSQQILPQIGMPAIKDYLKKFNYGNQDMSGDPGKNNGLENAWLSSSLKISAVEQIAFLKKFLLGQLPVSKHAVQMTENILYNETLSNGWLLYGKPGSGFGEPTNTTYDTNSRLGWFVGWVQKDNQIYVFATNFLGPKNYGVVPGPQAKELTKEIIKQLDLK